jgi:hypothetical protein
MDNYVLAKLVITRPSLSADFRSDFPDMPNGQYRRYVKETYQDTGKMLSTSESLTEDLLTLTFNTIWKNDAERVAYINDPIVKKYFEFIVAYRKNNNMIMDWINREYNGTNNTIIREWSGSFT